jgi:regulator of sigma E protease
LQIGETKLTYGLGESIIGGFGYGYETLSNYVTQFKYVFTTKGVTQVGGFGAIGSLFPDTWNWLSFWKTTALISIILAFMNILPIPALDGGHVMFLLYEMTTGRKPNDKFMEYAQMVGFFLLIALVLFANGNDIYRAIFGG